MHVNVNGIRMHCAVQGPEGAPVMLFIHGFPLTGAMWQPAVEHLATVVRCIVPDLRGFGQSDLAPPQARAAPGLGMADYADDLSMLLEALAVSGPVVVLGLSMGGYIAFELWRRARHRVRALVLADTRAEADPPARKVDRAAQAQRVLREGCATIADQMLPNLFAPGAPEPLKARWRGVMAAARPEAVAAAIGAMAGRPDSTPTLRTILAPTLIAVGEHDLITPPDLARVMHRAIITSRFAIIPDAGHMAPLEQPEAFAGLVREWLGEIGLGLSG
jgi:pimeloyl-ACP methyl ester carboxylesterase